MVPHFPTRFNGWRDNWSALPPSLGAFAGTGRSYSGSVLARLLFPVRNESVSFVICNKGSLDTFGFASISREIEHVTTAQQAFSTANIDHDARANRGTHHKRDARREIGLDG